MRGQCSGKAEFSLAENSHFMYQEIVLFPFLLIPLLQITTVTVIKKLLTLVFFLLFFSFFVGGLVLCGVFFLYF